MWKWGLGRGCRGMGSGSRGIGEWKWGVGVVVICNSAAGNRKRSGGPGGGSPLACKKAS